MQRVGFHCSHEQHAPSALLEHARSAERAGFAAAMCSDHLMPWSTREGQGQAGHTWSWLGAALQATSMRFGTVTAPGQRYHPAILAHAIATLAEMYEDRLWVAVATGEALNEHITDEPWPSKPERRERLRECVDVMRALLRGETVTHQGRIRVREAKLYSRPRAVPPLVGAALTVETARWAGAWADGLITVAAEPAKLREMIDAFRQGGGGDKPVYVQVACAYAPSDADAERIARAWSFAAIESSNFKSDVTLPEYFDAATHTMTRDELARGVRISASAQEHVDWVGTQLDNGAERVYVHHVGWTAAHQQRFLGDLAPALLKL